MADIIELTAGDGHHFGCYTAAPNGTPRGVVIVVQEIFGVNAHIQAVADDFATEGYLAVAPALFDRVERGVALGYGPADVEHGKALKQRAQPNDAMHDIAAVVARYRDVGNIGVVGYCWGGTIAWLTATRLPIVHAAVCYYGSNIPDHLGENQHCPTICHFGERDASIPPEAIERIRSLHPDVTIYRYPADHGFNCDQRASYDAQSARLARERTLALFTDHVG